MNMKITRFALAVKWGFFGRSGFALSLAALAAEPFNPKESSSPARASIPKPQEEDWRSWRRENMGDLAAKDEIRMTNVATVARPWEFSLTYRAPRSGERGYEPISTCIGTRWKRATNGRG